MRLAWVSPLPPSESGIADYSFELLPRIAEGAAVDAVYPGPSDLRAGPALTGIGAVDPDEFSREAQAYDAVFYHLGNNPSHEYVCRAAERAPGIVVLHDFVLHHLMEAILDSDGYKALMHSEHGADGRRLAELRIRGVGSAFEKFLFPLSASIARRATAVVVHSEDTRDRLREVVADTPIHVIPHHAGTPPSSVARVTREEARRALGLPPGAFIVGQFGFITPPKQPAAVLRAFAAMSARREDSVLVLVGADVVGMEASIHHRRLGGRVQTTGFVDLSRFYLYLKAVDVVVNLRYPTAGEASGTFSRALAEGRATIVSNVGSYGETPSEVAMKVEVDGDQSEQLANHLTRLAEDDSLRRDMEQNARRYAGTHLDAARCRDLYLEVARAKTAA